METRSADRKLSILPTSSDTIASFPLPALHSDPEESRMRKTMESLLESGFGSINLVQGRGE